LQAEKMVKWVKNILSMGVFSESMDNKKKVEKVRCSATFRKKPTGTNLQRKREQRRISWANRQRVSAEARNWEDWMHGRPISAKRAGKSSLA